MGLSFSAPCAPSPLDLALHFKRAFCSALISCSRFVVNYAIVDLELLPDKLEITDEFPELKVIPKRFVHPVRETVPVQASCSQSSVNYSPVTEKGLLLFIVGWLDSRASAELQRRDDTAVYHAVIIYTNNRVEGSHPMLIHYVGADAFGGFFLRVHINRKSLWQFGKSSLTCAGLVEAEE